MTGFFVSACITMLLLVGIFLHALLKHNEGE